MEESKELQGFYKIFRAAVYVSVLLEFFAYAIDPATLDHWGGILCDIHSRIKRWMIYTDGNLVYSKAATVLLICITCIGTRNKKHLEFDAKRRCCSRSSSDCRCWCSRYGCSAGRWSRGSTRCR